MPDPARGAAVAARIAAHAHAGGDEGKPGYEEAYAEERASQGGDAHAGGEVAHDRDQVVPAPHGGRHGGRGVRR